jgi:hypothetical protein
MEVAQKIINLYEKNFFSLSLGVQNHFCVRMWRLTGKKKYVLPILMNFQFLTLIFSRFFWMMKKEMPLPRLGKEIKKNSKLFLFYKNIMKKNFYENNPEILFLLILSHFLFNLKSFGMEKYLKDFFTIGKKYLEKINFRPFIFESNFGKVDPSEAINFVYYLYFLRVADFTKEFKKFIISFWEKENNLYNFKRKIYAFTHLIIAESYYYQRFVDPKENKEILEILERNLEKILKFTNPDVVGEVGLCFKLAKTENPDILKKIRDYLESAFVPSLGYIPYSGSLEKAEHRNIIAVLFLTPFSDLKPGPDLVKFIRDNRLGFYVPNMKKGIYELQR